MSRLLSSLPVGSLVKDDNFTYNSNTPIFRVLEHGHAGDPQGSSTLEFRDLICLKCFDAKESSSQSTGQQTYGNNRYLYSNILQWLNSDASANHWYVAQHAADAPPTTENVKGGSNPYDTEAGFLSFFTDGLKAALLSTTKQAMTGPSHGVDTTIAKIFLFAAQEVGLTNGTSHITTGTLYAYYNDSDAVNRRKKKVIGSTHTNFDKWYLRDAQGNSESIVQSVGSDGQSGSLAYPYDGRAYGIGPAFCISSDTKVSDTPDSNGVYSFVWNKTPTISPATTNYGSRTTPPAITTTITDPDGDSFTYTIKLNGVTKASGSATGTKTIALDMTSYWGQMALGSNTIVVSVTDSNGATASATYTMNKTNSAPPVPTTDLTNNSRKETSFYVGFQIGQDADGDSQTVVVQVSASSAMTSPTEFSGVEKLVAGAWIPVQTLTNADAGASLRIQVTGQTVGNTVYVRLKDSDSGSGSSVYTSVYTIKIGSVLEFDTLPITRTTKPTMVVAYLDKTKPSDATVQMFACNNANDGTPTWEPITEGVTHEFTNKTKTAANWGVSVKTSIAAGATAGEISVSAIGVGVL